MKKKITPTEYQKRMDKVIEKNKNKSIDETFIALIDEAAKYELCETPLQNKPERSGRRCK